MLLDCGRSFPNQILEHRAFGNGAVGVERNADGLGLIAFVEDANHFFFGANAREGISILGTLQFFLAADLQRFGITPDFGQLAEFLR